MGYGISDDDNFPVDLELTFRLRQRAVEFVNKLAK
jgi:hypothetical protein